MKTVRPIGKNEAYYLIYEFHYSKVLPKLNKYFIGCFENEKLIGVITLGWGVRPLHTIKKLFPSLSTQDYLEIGKMCFDDRMPKNTESEYIAMMINWVKKNTNIKIIYTWADGMLGKAGYVYQASNFLYGGYILTDSYFSKEGEKIHPRMTGKIGGRPNKEKQKQLGWKHYQGKQFRYLYFVCDKREKKKLLKECTIQLSNNYPKEKDLLWKIQTEEGYIKSKKPDFQSKKTDFYISKNGTTEKRLFDL